MKSIFKSIAVIAIFLFFSTISFSQLYFGFKGGVSIPNLTAGGGNPVSSGWSSRLGPYAGILITDSLNEIFSLQAELNYSSEGGKKNGEQALPDPISNTPQYFYANYKSVVRLNYIELPILLKAGLQLSKNLTLFVDGGPYAAYLASAQNIGSGTSGVYSDEAETMPIIPSQSFDSTQNIKSSIKSFNVGVQIGVGLALRVGSGKLILTGGGNYGFIPIQKDSQDGTNNTGAATITLGYLFKI